MTIDHETEQRLVAAHKLGLRDARLGHAETAPVRPHSAAELEAYQAGYRGERKRLAASQED